MSTEQGMNVMNTLLLSLIFLSADPTEPKVVLNMEKLDKLVVIRECIEAAEKLEGHGADVEGITNDLLKEASEIAGKTITYEELKSLTGGSKPPPTKWDKFKGFVTFINVLWITGAFIIVFSICWLGRIYLFEILCMIPPKVYEALCYAASFGLIVGGSQLDPEFSLVLVLPGALGLIGCLTLTKFLRFDEYDSIEPFVYILTVMWGVIALCYGSEVIGFLTVIALLSAVGFTCGHAYHVIWIGFESEEVVARTTASAGLILGFHILLSITGTVTQIDVFRTGMSFMGSFVYFLGVLILAGKWMCYEGHYSHINWSRYWTMQVLTFASGIAALYLGNVYGIGHLTGIGGTFFYIYLLEKYAEVPWKGDGWAWAFLGLGGILYGFGVFAKRYPEHFIFMGV